MSAQRKLAKLFGANVGSLQFESSRGLVRLYSSAVLSTIVDRCLTDAAVDLCNNLNALQVGDFLRCVCLCSSYLTFNNRRCRQIFISSLGLMCEFLTFLLSLFFFFSSEFLEKSQHTPQHTPVMRFSRVVKTKTKLLIRQRQCDFC